MGNLVVPCPNMNFTHHSLKMSNKTNKRAIQYISECTANSVILGLHFLKKSCIFLIRLVLQKMASNIRKPNSPLHGCCDSSLVCDMLDKRTFLQYIKCRLEIAVSDLFYLLQASIKIC